MSIGSAPLPSNDPIKLAILRLSVILSTSMMYELKKELNVYKNHYDVWTQKRNYINMKTFMNTSMMYELKKKQNSIDF